MVIVGLDIGQVRIGVAVSDVSGSLASPRGFIRRRSNASAIEAILRVVAESKAELVVVGLPVSFDGQLHAQAQAVRSFAAKLRARLGDVPLAYADETLSTVRAEEALRAAGVRPERMRERIDSAAAAVILQEYLDRGSGATVPSLANELPEHERDLDLGSELPEHAQNAD